MEGPPTVLLMFSIFETHTGFCPEAGIAFKNVMINLGKPTCPKIEHQEP